MRGCPVGLPSRVLSRAKWSQDAEQMCGMSHMSHTQSIKGQVGGECLASFPMIETSLLVPSTMRKAPRVENREGGSKQAAILINAYPEGNASN